MPYDLRNGQYPYPLNYLNSDGGTVNADFVANDPSVEPDSDNWYVLCLTPDELLEMQSVIAVGAPIALPDTYNGIIQKFSQLREYPNEIPEGSCMDMCNLIIECIEETPELQQLIAEYGIGATPDILSSENPVNLARLQITNRAGCNKDTTFGQCIGMVDLLNSMSERILNNWQALASPAARIGDLIEGIPLIGSLPVDDFFQFSEAVIADIQAGYGSAWDLTVRDDIACELFCVSEDSCTLT